MIVPLDKKYDEEDEEDESDREDEDEEYGFLASERRSQRIKPLLEQGTGGRRDSDYRCSRSSWCRWCCSCWCCWCCCCCQQWRRAVCCRCGGGWGRGGGGGGGGGGDLLLARRQHRLSTDMRRVAVFQAQIVAITAVS